MSVDTRALLGQDLIINLIIVGVLYHAIDHLVRLGKLVVAIDL
jgi:hypothetical protein